MILKIGRSRRDSAEAKVASASIGIRERTMFVYFKQSEKEKGRRRQSIETLW
jgi:hypothetical protein